jgi:hypothetical protein
MAVEGITSTVVILQFWKCVLPIVEKKDPIDDCEFAIEAVRSANDDCKLTIDAVLADFGRVKPLSCTVSRCFTTTYGREYGAVAVGDVGGAHHAAFAGPVSIFVPAVEGREGGAANRVVNCYPGLFSSGGEELAFGEPQRVVNLGCHADAPFLALSGA